LAHHWRRWLAVTGAAFVLWLGATALTMPEGGVAPLGLQLTSDVAFALTCTAGCYSMCAVFLRYATGRSRALDGLAANAYGIYLVHYPFVVWLQYALLGAALFAVVKASIVFGLSLVLSWAVVAALRHLPLGSRVLGAQPALAAPHRAKVWERSG
jgi:peptidoglycan/LPS O-acetylase OafA/YrhL